MKRRRFFSTIVSAFVAASIELGAPRPCVALSNTLDRIFRNEAHRLAGAAQKNLLEPYRSPLRGQDQSFPGNLGEVIR